MTGYIGETIRIAVYHARGLTNDHVEVLPTGELPERYSVFVREGYDVGGGPELEPSRSIGSEDNRLLSREVRFLAHGETERDWRDIDRICRDTPLDDALDLARTESKRRNIVLYLGDLGPNDEILWHPDGWEPVEG